MIDMDYFKQVNDTFGHDAGDALLKALAGQLRRAFRQSDTVARLGGDEFAVLVRDIADPNVLLRPVAALEALLKNPVQYNGQEFVISTSIGAAFHAPGEINAGLVLKNADLAMYEAKSAGRGRSVLFQNTMRTRVEERLQLLRDVRRGLSQREFSLVYQPIIDLGLDRVETLEAQVRWNHPELGPLAPAAFKQAFDDPEAAPLLSDFAFEGVLEQLRAWMDQGLTPPTVAIKVSPAQLRDGRLAREISGRLTRWEVPGDRLAIEVNETMSSPGDLVASDTVRRLAACGVNVTLDNFGAGQGSLGNPRDYPVNRLKISKTFVSNFNPEIIGSILRVGQALGLQVVADGVEGGEALEAVRQMGCTHAQGFYFSQPMSAHEAGRYLNADQDRAAGGDAAGPPAAGLPPSLGARGRSASV
jgi:diguanylate cyclase (GGDEF)-like protein